MFFKMSEGFKIETSIGTYNPDWAVYLDRDGEEKLYFVLETKGRHKYVRFTYQRAVEDSLRQAAF